MSWSLNRQIIIFLIVTGFFALTAFILWFIYHPRPSCYDGKLNQNELDIDCGGICSQVCAIEVSQPITWWQQAFPLIDGNYGVAALIENKNDKFGINRLDYQFKIFGSGQILLATVPGSTFVNPNERIIIYKPNVFVGGGEPNRVILEILDVSWSRQNNPKPMLLSKSEASFVNSSPNPQARVTITNNSLETYQEVDVFVVLSDANRNVFGVSQTYIPTINAGEAREVFFNWPQPFNMPTTTEVIIDVYPRFNTLER